MESIWLAQAVGLFYRLMTGITEAHLRKEYRARIWRYLKYRRNPGMLAVLHDQDRPALSRVHDGDADEVGADAGL